MRVGDAGKLVCLPDRVLELQVEQYITDRAYYARRDPLADLLGKAERLMEDNNGKGEATFALTIRDTEWRTLAQGQSRSGETWEQTFLRLYQAMLPFDAPLRRLALDGNPGVPTGAAAKIVITTYTDEVGRVRTDRTVIIHTRPAQF